MHATLTLVDSNLLLLLLSLGGEEIWNLRKPKNKILYEVPTTFIIDDLLFIYKLSTKGSTIQNICGFLWSYEI
jgi:hypothetical protein